MIIVGSAALIITACGYKIAFEKPSAGDVALYIALSICHVAASLVYWQYSMLYGADSWMYYDDAMEFSKFPIKAGTLFVIHFVGKVRSTLGGTYWEFFLLFQSFGMIGIALIVRAFREISADLEHQLPLWVTALLFLPGLHFWTSAIGKDAPLFLAVALAVWSMIRVERRFPMLIAAIAIMVAFRPHIAAVTVIAFIMTLIFDARIKLAFKLPLAIVAVAGVFLILATVESTFRLGGFDSETIAEFISSKQAYGVRTEGADSVANLALPLKIASLLFRPFFFDADGAFGLIVSFENAVMLFIFGVLAVRMPTVIRLAASVPYVRFSLIFAVALIVLLSMVSFNVGLGLRQKFMAMPAVLVLFMTVVTYRRARADHVRAKTQADQAALVMPAARLR